MTQQLTLAPDQPVAFLDAQLHVDRLVIPSYARADDALVDSVKKFGVLSPVVVAVCETGNDEDEGGFWQVVAGRRRVDAARRAGLEVVPCRVLSEDASSWHGQEVIAITENARRKDNFLSDLDAIRRLMEYGFSLDQISRELRLPKPRIGRLMRLAGLPPELMEQLRDGLMKKGVAEEVAKLSHDQREELAELARGGKVITREIAQEVRQVGRQSALAALPISLFEGPSLGVDPSYERARSILIDLMPVLPAKSKAATLLIKLINEVQALMPQEALTA